MRSNLRCATGLPRTNAIESLERRMLMSSAPLGVGVAMRYGNELTITANGSNDSIALSQSRSQLTLVADGKTSSFALPAGGVFIYTRGGKDSISIASSVVARTTVDTIDNAVTTLSSAGTNVIAWVDSTDRVTGSASVHKVANFTGGVSKALHASLPSPSDSGRTATASVSLFGTGPVASDINQGEVGDCYFLSSLAAFANQRPQALLNSAADLGDGTYAVEFYSSGHPVFVRVNNSFSVGGFNGWNYAHPGVNDTSWAMVMEKAFAYFRYGSNTYASITAGWMSEVYADLNVTSTDLTPARYSDLQLFNLLSTDLDSGAPITMVAESAPDLVNNHAYTLMGVQRLNGATRYIVRNPWGFAGDNLENSQGIAVLTYREFVENFDKVTIALK